MNFLKIGGTLSFLVSVLHVCIIFGGSEWYRFFGAGLQASREASLGSTSLTAITLLIAFVFAAWGLYAFSGSGSLPRFPLLRPCLVAITFVYLLRGILGLIIPFFSTHPKIAENSISFWMWSSSICLCFGLIHLKGVIDNWASMRKR